MKQLFSFIISLLFLASAYATHNRAGEITYRQIQGLTYEITIRTCTDISSPDNADREYLPILWGDGTSLDSIQRTEEVLVVPNSIKENWYIATHTYPGPGTYELYVEDPNRNDGIVNISNSINQVFSITSVLVIGSQGFNNSVQLLNPPKGNACIFKPWIHNPAAFDPDGDSLKFELIPSTGANGVTVPGFLFLDQVSPGPSNNLSINSQTGDIIWDSPQLAGEYNLAIRISEYRKILQKQSVLQVQTVDP